jgi:hypothetical protein
MPLRQYFMWVGGFLLLGLFAADWCLPAPVVHARSAIPPQERVNLRIHSDQKWPERVVFDTTGSRLASAADKSPVPEVLASRDRGQAKQLTLLFLQTLNRAWFGIEESEHATNWKTHRS